MLSMVRFSSFIFSVREEKRFPRNRRDKDSIWKLD